MSKREEIATIAEESGEQSEELAVMAPALRERFVSLMDQIPEADSDEAMFRIVEQILAAETAEDLDEPWSGMGMKKIAGRLLQVRDLRRLPSDFAGGPGWYFGCDCVLRETGETLFVTTGSLSILAQLATAYLKGMLPINVVPRISERKSRRGFYPMHLEIARGVQ